MVGASANMRVYMEIFSNDDDCTVEQLKIFLHNSEYVVDSLRMRLKKLTGCNDFGNVDGMNGSCVECFYDNRELFNKCWNFRFDK